MPLSCPYGLIYGLKYKNGCIGNLHHPEKLLKLSNV